MMHGQKNIKEWNVYLLYSLAVNEASFVGMWDVEWW